jgi:hypothetical protein
MRHLRFVIFRRTASAQVILSSARLHLRLIPEETTAFLRCGWRVGRIQGALSERGDDEIQTNIQAAGQAVLEIERAPRFPVEDQ